MRDLQDFRPLEFEFPRYLPRRGQTSVSGAGSASAVKRTLGDGLGIRGAGERGDLAHFS
jgi:hypothetical protein